MAILRRNAETVEVVGLDEAYVELTGLFCAEGDDEADRGRDPRRRPG